MEYYIWGAGRYGKALNRFLFKRGIEVKAFIQTAVSLNDSSYVKNTPVISFDDFNKEKDYNRVVLISVNDNSLRVMAKSKLLINDTVPKENIIDCAKLIEANCLGEEGDYYCSLCGKELSGFVPYGIDVESMKRLHIIGEGLRDNARCPVCGSLDRNRWCFYVLEKYTEMLNEPCSVLHFAPEKYISDMIETNEMCDYVTADLERGKAMLSVDATNIPFRDEIFDYVIANHILEHIPNDKKALSEIKRVLKKDGKAIISFPICTDQPTIEDDGTATEDERLNRYGQRDHVRLYGTDYKERLEEAGFKVDVKSPKDELGQEQIERFGYIADDVVMILSKT